jgi:WD40 repeat protein
VGLASFTHVDRAGAHYVSVGFYGDVVVWDAKTGAPIRHDPGSGGPHGLAASPDGRRVAVAGDGTLVVWSVPDLQRLVEFDLPTRDGFTTSVAWSPDGRRIAAGQCMVPGSPVTVFPATGGSGRLLEAPAGDDEGCVYHLAWQADGARLYGSDGDGRLLVWSADGDLLASPKVAGTAAKCLAVDPKGLVGVGGTDAAVNVWDASTRAVESYGFFGGWCEALAFSPDGKWLAGDVGGELRVWSRETRREVARWRGLAGHGAQIVFSADSTVLAWPRDDRIVRTSTRNWKHLDPDPPAEAP